MPPTGRHILLRYAQSLSGLEDTISEHQAVLAREGAVFFGKVGRPFGKATIDAIEQQSATGEDAFLFLAARTGQEFVVHRAVIDLMCSHLPPTGRGLVPDYYARSGLSGRIGTWFRLSQLDRIAPATLTKLVVAKTGTPILSVLGSSRSSMFIVSAKTGVNL